VFRVHGSSAPGRQEFRVPRTALTAGMLAAVAAAVSAGLLLSAGGGPSNGRMDRVKAPVAAAPTGTANARQAPALQKSK
jgi:hypothetical protein